MIKQRVRLSVSFRQAIKDFNRPVYKIAALADVCPSMLYRATNGVENFVPGDGRILRIADTIGFKGECFEIEQQIMTVAQE